MRRSIVALLTAATVAVGIVTAYGPAEATAPPTSITASTVVDEPTVGDSTDAIENQIKMGALPAQYKICVANGIVGYNTEYVLEKWTQLSYGALNLVVQNRCSDYSITNRLTVETYSSSAGGCGKFTQAGNHWDAAQGKYIYDQNPVVWLNTRDSCVPTDSFYAHRLAMYVGYILGVNYQNCNYYVMCNTSYALQTAKYVTGQDKIWMAGVYGLTA